MILATLCSRSLRISFASSASLQAGTCCLHKWVPVLEARHMTRHSKELVKIPGIFWTTTKKFKLFPGGLRLPQTPPSSRLLSQPPRDRFERLSQVGRCRGLQGLEVLAQWSGRTTRSSPATPADSGTFFLGSIPELFSVSVSSHFQEI